LLRFLFSESPVFPSKFNTIAIRYAEEISQDLSISRPVTRCSWGIPVPGDPSQIIYVWLDALASYLTVSGYPRNHMNWPPSLQVIGKDILKFHTIYWPSLLMAAELQLPKRIFCHSHWTKDGQKMSKSLGNVVDPFSLSEKYSSDGLRYFLLQAGVPQSDGNFTEEKLRRLLNSELADTLGNLLSRCSAKSINPNQLWPMFPLDYFQSCNCPYGISVIESVELLPTFVSDAYNSLHFHLGIDQIMTTIRLTNCYVQNEKPWELVKRNPTDEQLFLLLSIVFEVLRVTSMMLLPITPNLSDQVLHQLNIPVGKRRWKDIKPFIWNRKFSESRMLESSQNLLFKRVK